MNVFLKMMLTYSSLTIPRKKVRQLVLKRMEQHLWMLQQILFFCNWVLQQIIRVIFLWVQDIGWIKTAIANDILVFENEIFKNISFPYRYMIQKNIISKSKNDLTSITENTDTVQKLIQLQEQDNSKTLCCLSQYFE